VHADPEARARVVVIDAEVVQRLAHVVVGLAAGDQAEAVARAADHVAVQRVGAHVGQRRVPLVLEEPRLLLERVVGPAHVHAACGQREILGQHDAHALGVDVDRGRGLDHLLDRLHPGPDAGEAAHREGVQPEVQDLLHAAREEHRQPAGLEDVVALVRGGAALGDVVVTGDGDHPAVARGAGHVGVLEGVAAAVHARALAVPDAEDAVELLLVGEEIQQLRAPERGRCKLLVDRGLEDDVLRREVRLGLPQRLVVAAERAAAVAADVARGVQPRGGVAHALQHRQPHQRLHAAHEGAAACQRVLVVERDGFQGLADGVGQRCVHGERARGQRCGAV